MPTSLVAVLDADVLVPILSCDLLLSAFDHDLYQPAVTNKILDEAGTNLRQKFPKLEPAAVERRVAQMRVALALHIHPAGADTAAVDPVNPKDRHVASVAIDTHADVVVTNDRRLRRELRDLSPPVKAVTADDFTVALSESDPDGMNAVIGSMVAKRRHPVITRDELLTSLRPGFPGLVQRLAAHEPG